MAATSATTADDIRASDAERQAVVDRLHAAVGEGRLDLTEADARVAAAYAAQYRRDLPPLLADLPEDAAGHPTDGGAPTWAALWTAFLWRAGATLWRPDGRPRVRPMIVVAVALLVLGATAGLVLGHLDAASAVPPGPGQLPDRFRDFPPYQN